MGKRVTGLKLVAGLLLYILDVGSDTYVAIRCYKEPEKTEYTYAVTIVIFLSISTVIVNVVAFWTRSKELGIHVYGVAFLGQLCVIVRYVEQLVGLKKGNSVDKNTDRKLALVRCTIALFQSAPQCYIQTFMMLDLWYFPWYIIASTNISFVSLVWGFASVTISDVALSDNHENDDDSHDDNHEDEINRPLGLVIVLFFSQLGFLVSRISLLVIFTYAFRHYFLIICSIRLLILVEIAVGFIFYILFCYILCCCCCPCKRINEFVHKVWVVNKIFLMSFFDVSICLCKFKLLCILHFLENGIMFLLLMWCPPVISIQLELLRFIALPLVLGGLGAGILFFGIYYKCCHGESENPVDIGVQENDRIPHSPPRRIAFIIQHQHVRGIPGTCEENGDNALNAP